ncbi:SCO family protein [Polynucleobacter kasalickyi]|uniref:Protein SCO1/2 n=1 Tax=Polynucleobacter kasalickyi TaxID=1938817 RepID=A0A1W2AR27_9BURK|nr:SCO family protein [Polynucleobacter kasalickyi]SMC63123.1 protein SCO1/2 [Polynucleobacter kasalickyi]
MFNQTNFIRILRFSIVFCAVSFLTACDFSAKKFFNTDITGASSFNPNFELVDQLGNVRHLSDFKGKVAIIFFGYTQCPDVCPTTLMEIKEVVELLGKDKDKLQVIFITVDPERDTQEVLAQYIPSFDPSFLGLRPATPEALEQVVKGFKIFVRKESTQDGKYYTMSHTSGSYVVDQDGKLRLFIKHNQGAQTLVNDLKQLIN